jgi:hypothetical protein
MMMISDDPLFVSLKYRIGFAPENYYIDAREYGGL